METPKKPVIPLCHTERGAVGQRWQKTRHTNLVRSRSGLYYIRAKVGGQLINESLHTKTEKIALLRLDERIRKARRASQRPASGVILFHQVADDWLSQVEQDPHLQPRTRDYKAECLRYLYRVAPSLESVEVAGIDRRGCRAWMDSVRRQYSSTRHNGMLQTLRSIFSLAVEEGHRADNPCDGIKHIKVKDSQFDPPDRATFNKLIDHLAGHRESKRALSAVQLMAYTGLRINEARQLLPEHVRLDRNEIAVPAEIAKRGDARRIPILPEFKPILVEILRNHDGRGTLIGIKDPKKAIHNACDAVGISPRLTPHKFRHLFASYAIMAGVDIPTAALWLGHKDRGALLLKRYAHLLDEHSQKMAARVSFRPQLVKAEFGKAQVK